MTRLPVIVSIQALIGVVCAVFLTVSIAPTTAGAVPGTAYIYRGMAPEPQACEYWGQFAGVNGCWHDDEAGTFTAIDFNWGSTADADAWVLVQLWYTGTRQYPSFVATTSPCHGLTATFYHDSSRTMYAGEVHFLHTHPYANVIGTSYDVNGGDHYYRDLGEVSGWENSGCAWTAPHLHQSADTSAGTAFYTNWNGDPTTSWVHLIQ